MAAWALGRSIRYRRAYTSELETRAQRLESEREAEVRATLAEERARIARELHDVVAHSISSRDGHPGGRRPTSADEPTSERPRSLDALADDRVAPAGQAMNEMRRVARGPAFRGRLVSARDMAPAALARAISRQLVDTMREAGLDRRRSAVDVAGDLGGLPAGCRTSSVVSGGAGGADQRPQARRTRCRRLGAGAVVVRSPDERRGRGLPTAAGAQSSTAATNRAVWTLLVGPVTA